MKSVILLALCSVSLSAQMVEGDVYDAVTKAPLPGASVTTGASVTNGAPNADVVRTDPAGHFRIQLPANSAYNLQLTRVGYLRDLRSFRPVRGKPLASLHIELTPEAIITGTVVDEDGFPVERAQIQASRYATINGERKLQFVMAVQSNDRGEYRLNNLPTGRFYIRTSGGDAFNWDARYVPQFLGGGLLPDEDHILEVKAGEVHNGVDVRLKRYEGATVTGRVDGLADTSQSRLVFVRLEGVPSEIGSYSASMTPGSANWTIRHVPPGNYILRYTSGPNPPKAGDRLAELPVQVAATDLRDLVLTPVEIKPLDLEGKIALDGTGPLGTWTISATNRMLGQSATAQSNEDGSFVLKGLLPGHYDLQAYRDYRDDPSAAKSPAFAISARLGEKEVLSKGIDLGLTPPNPLHITVSTRVANLSGRILNSSGQPIANTQIVFQSTVGEFHGVAVTNDTGDFRAMLTHSGDFRVNLTADRAELNLLGEDDYFKAHENDFPLIHAVEGTNPPLTLIRKAK